MRRWGAGLRLKAYTDEVNVGDVFAVHLARARLSPQVTVIGRKASRRNNLLLVGSIMNWADARTTVAGAGVLCPGLVPPVPPRRIISVRGPMSAALMRGAGLSVPPRYADPGVLAPSVFPADGSVRHGVGIVPHLVDRGHPWLERCRAQGHLVLDPATPPEEFLSQLASCEVVLSSSLHGLIFAHAYGRPARWIQLSDLLPGGPEGFKFRDYLAGVQVHGRHQDPRRPAGNDDVATVTADAFLPDLSASVAAAEESLAMVRADFLPG